MEIDRESGEVVWEFNAADAIDKEDGQSASIATDGSDEIDWFHNNSLWYDEKNDLVLLSARHKDAIIAIHKSDKSLAWILGDPANWNGVDKNISSPRPVMILNGSMHSIRSLCLITVIL